MPDSPIGDPIPYVPIPPGREVFPGREGNVERELERAVPFPDSPDQDILERLRAEAGGGGRSGSGGRTGTFDVPPGEPTDTLAFYRSFRYDGKWGVFILKSGLSTVAGSFLRMGATAGVAHDAARYFLQNHETAHFLVDRAVLTLESVMALATGKQPGLWVDYNRRHASSLLEEAVANAYAHRMARPGARNLVGPYIKSLPAGYRDVDFDRRHAGTTWGSFQQSDSQLLSDYLVSKYDEGERRAVGLHTLMAYNDLRSGTNGDLFFKRQGGSLEKLPVWLVR